MTDRLSEIKERLAKVAECDTKTIDSCADIERYKRAQQGLHGNARKDLEWACAYIERLEARLRSELMSQQYETGRHLSDAIDSVDAEMAKLKEGK